MLNNNVFFNVKQAVINKKKVRKKRKTFSFLGHVRIHLTIYFICMYAKNGFIDKVGLFLWATQQRVHLF